MIYKNIKCTSYICLAANLEKKVICSKYFGLNYVKKRYVYVHNNPVT